MGLITLSCGREAPLMVPSLEGDYDDSEYDDDDVVVDYLMLREGSFSDGPLIGR